MPSRIDVIRASYKILKWGARGETMASQQEVRAMAAAVLDFAATLDLTRQCLTLISNLGDEPGSGERRAQVLEAFSALEKEMVRIGFMAVAPAEEREAA